MIPFSILSGTVVSRRKIQEVSILDVSRIGLPFVCRGNGTGIGMRWSCMSIAGKTVPIV